MKINTIAQWIAVAGLLGGGSAQALPLVAENAKLDVAGILTVYPDSQDPNFYYFMPNTAHLQTDSKTGRPRFGMTYWGLDSGAANAGGYMNFIMRMALSADEKMAIDSLIAQGKKVAILPIKSSMLTMSAAGTDEPLPFPELFKRLNQSKVGPRPEDDMAFTALLTDIGANVMRGMLRTGASTGMKYCWTFQGLGPNFDAHIHVDWRAVYDRFAANTTFSHWFVSVHLEKVVEELKKDGLVKITINGGDAKDQEYVKAVAADIASKLFYQEPPKPGASPDPESGMISIKLGSYHGELDSQVDWDIVRRDLVTRDFCQDVQLDDVAAYYNDLVINVDSKPHP